VDKKDKIHFGVSILFKLKIEEFKQIVMRIEVIKIQF
jgi:hypothetical protein